MIVNLSLLTHAPLTHTRCRTQSSSTISSPKRIVDSEDENNKKQKKQKKRQINEDNKQTKKRKYN